MGERKCMQVCVLRETFCTSVRVAERVSELSESDFLCQCKSLRRSEQTFYCLLFVMVR